MHLFRYLLVTYFFLIATSVSNAASNCETNQCVAVIDAGSTGSRLHIYAYNLDKTKTPINIHEVWNKKISPGFATIEPNTVTINNYLNSLFANTPGKNLKVYFYATAGMRLLPATKQKKYYDELKGWFAGHTEWQLQDAKTITGNEEALFDWLSVNYHAGSFQGLKSQTTGVMDMGGASVQVVFPVKDKLPSNTIQLTLYGQKYTLYVRSFLGLGLTETSHQFLNAEPCFSQNYPLPDGDLGQGDAYACAQKVANLVNTHDVSKTVQPILAANPVSTWYTIGGLANVADHKLFHFNGQFTSQELIQQSDSQVCQQNWDNLSEQFPNDDYVHLYCFSPSYYYSLMVDGYGITPEQLINYMAPNKNVDWTTGVVLYPR